MLNNHRKPATLLDQAIRIIAVLAYAGIAATFLKLAIWIWSQ